MPTFSPVVWPLGAELLLPHEVIGDDRWLEACAELWEVANHNHHPGKTMTATAMKAAPTTTPTLASQCVVLESMSMGVLSRCRADARLASHVAPVAPTVTTATAISRVLDLSGGWSGGRRQRNETVVFVP